ncbi:MAG: type III pantothenate kinase [Chlamydiae bacterium]|nr:type III pantothenate kinase [Chlamydiota bacterium]
MSHCVIDIGNTNITLGFFSDDRLIGSRSGACSPDLEKSLLPFLREKSIEKAFVASTHEETNKTILKILHELAIPVVSLDPVLLSLTIDVDEPREIGHDRIAGVYGALHHFPTFDCIVIDIGTTVTFDYVTKEGTYIGGAIYPGAQMSAKALANDPGKLPLVETLKPQSALGKTTKESIQSGIYYGLLGAIERVVAELCLCSLSPSSVKVLATGDATRMENAPTCEDRALFLDDLKDLTDTIDPHLKIVGLYEIFKEQLLKKQEK